MSTEIGFVVCIQLTVLIVMSVAMVSPGAKQSTPAPAVSAALNRKKESPVRPARIKPGKSAPDTDAVERLSKVFGIEKVPTSGRLPRHPRSAPEYMVELYQNVAYNDGISKTSSPYEADVVRGMPDRASLQQVYFFFNVSHVSKQEKILQAELHLFKLRPRGTEGGQGTDDEESPAAKKRRTRRHFHVINIRLYQVLREGADEADPEGLKLVDQRRLSAQYKPGWETFKVSETVMQWINESSTNHGFLVTATSSDGSTVLNDTAIRFAQRLQHHDSKQPVLVVFSDDDRKAAMANNPDLLDDPSYQPPPASDSDLKTMRQNYIKFLNEGYRAQHEQQSEIKHRHNYMSPIVHQRLLNVSSSAPATQSKSRSQRSPASDNISRYARRRKKTCQRHEMYVDFEKIGWSGWIISPKGYNAYQCKGVCPFPLGQNQKPSNHATVQSIVHALKIGAEVDTPCCVPNKLYSISLLYFDDEENVILKQYDEMVAASCGCH